MMRAESAELHGGEKEMMELRERGVKKKKKKNEKRVKVTKGQTNYPAFGGHVYFSTRNTQTCNNVITIR